GGNGFAGSIIVDTLSETTQAFISSQALVNSSPPPAGASRSISIHATDQVTHFGAAGGLSATIHDRAGGGLNFSAPTRDTEAIIGSFSSVTADQDVSVQADATDSVTEVAGAADAGKSFNLAGAVSFYTPVTTTRAFIARSTTVTAGGNVTVAATHQDS